MSVFVLNITVFPRNVSVLAPIKLFWPQNIRRLDFSFLFPCMIFIFSRGFLGLTIIFTSSSGFLFVYLFLVFLSFVSLFFFKAHCFSWSACVSFWLELTKLYHRTTIVGYFSDSCYIYALRVFELFLRNIVILTENRRKDIIYSSPPKGHRP